MESLFSAAFVYLASVATSLTAVSARYWLEEHRQKRECALYVMHLIDDLILKLHTNQAELLTGNMGQLIEIRKYFRADDQLVQDILALRNAFSYAVYNKSDDQATRRETINRYVAALETLKATRKLGDYVKPLPWE